MVRFEKLDDVGGGFVSHRNTFTGEDVGPAEREVGVEHIVKKARIMFNSPDPEQVAPANTGLNKVEPQIAPQGPSQLDQLDAQVEKLNDRFEQMEFTFADTGRMVDELRAELSDMTVRISGVNLDGVMDALADLRDSHAAELMSLRTPHEPQPDPMMASLLEQMQAMRSDMSQHNELAQRLEARLDGLAQKVEASNAVPDPSIALQDALTTRLDAVNALVERIAQDQNHMAEVLSGVALPEALSTLRDDLATLAARGEPVLDLTEQRESFAQFNQSADAFLRRLECLIATMASDHVRSSQAVETALSSREAEAEDLAQALRHLSVANTALAGLLGKDADKSVPDAPDSE